MMKNKKLVIALIVIAIIAVIAVSVLMLVSKNTGATPKALIRQAEILDWESVKKEVSNNKAKAEDYENKWYIFRGEVSRIDEADCTLETIKRSKKSSSLLIKVKMDTETLKELKKGDTITVVGKLVNVASSPILTDAVQLDDETIQENLVVAVRSKRRLL